MWTCKVIFRKNNCLHEHISARNPSVILMLIRYEHEVLHEWTHSVKIVNRHNKVKKNILPCGGGGGVDKYVLKRVTSESRLGKKHTSNAYYAKKHIWTTLFKETRSSFLRCPYNILTSRYVPFFLEIINLIINAHIRRQHIKVCLRQ